MISVHAIPFPNGEILFYGRPAEPYGMFSIPHNHNGFPFLYLLRVHQIVLARHGLVGFVCPTEAASQLQLEYPFLGLW